MNRLLLIATFGAIVVVAGCSTEPEQVRPAQRGERGESCTARNDCASGLACISGICSKNDFDIDVVAKQCDRIDCSEDKDCCGSKPLTAPAKCADRVNICETPDIEGCSAFDSCSTDTDCNGGTCSGQGNCALSGGSCTNDTSCYSSDLCVAGYCARSGGICVDNSDCYGGDVCSSGVCSVTGIGCVDDSDCYGQDTCGDKYCECDNPNYDPWADICSDSDCDDVCTLRCEEELCVPDNTCSTDADCFFTSANICSSGRCVECESSDDCDADENCIDGRCERGCKQDEECPLFHACQNGECVETGCKSDRECVLAAASGAAGSIEDARLSKCLDSDNPDENFNVCKIPCENDGACGEFSVCDMGFCKFIGCQTDEDCRALLGLENEQVTDAKPYVSQAVCRE